METVELVDGKYTIYLHEESGKMRFLRNGEAWPAGQEMFEHAGLVMALVSRVVELGNAHSGLVEALNEILRVHANDNIRPKAFYIASEALTAAGVK